MANDKQEYLRVLATLETNELAVLYRQSANVDPAGLKRSEMLAKLEDLPIRDDFHRQVGEIQDMLRNVQEGIENGDGAPGAKREPELLEPDESIFSSQPGKWTPVMSIGPDRTETSNRVKWARLVYQEQKLNRERLLLEAGVFLCDWCDRANDFVPLPDDDESAADTATLCFRTPNGKTTLAWVGQHFDLDLNMLLHVNSSVYPSLRSTSTEFKKSTMIVLEEEIPEDMIEMINEIYCLDRDDPTDPKTPEKRPAVAPGSSGEKRPAPPQIDAAAMSAKHAAKRARRPKTAAHDSIAAEGDAIRKFLETAVAEGKLDGASAARLGVQVEGAKSASAPGPSQPRTAEAARIEKATADTQARIDLTAQGGEQGNWNNPFAFHRVENMAPEQRLRMLEGTKSLPMFSDPTEFANATARLAIDNPALSSGEKESAIRAIFQRELAMNTYVKSANLGPDEVRRVMSQVSLDLVVGASEDETLKSFEKRTQNLVNKKLKKAASGSAASAPGDVAASVAGALKAEFPHVFQKQTRNERRNAYFNERFGEGGGRDGGGRGGGKHGRGGRGRGACFVCGSVDHQAMDCPRRFAGENAG